MALPRVTFTFSFSCSALDLHFLFLEHGRPGILWDGLAYMMIVEGWSEQSSAKETEKVIGRWDTKGCAWFFCHHVSSATLSLAGEEEEEAMCNESFVGRVGS